MSKKVRMRAWIDGLRLKNMERLLRIAQHESGVDLKITNRQKHFLWETVFFQVTGQRSQVALFQRVLESFDDVEIE